MAVSSPQRIPLHYTGAFDTDALYGFVGPRAIPGVEAVDAGVYRRTLRVGSRAGWFEASPAGTASIEVTVHGVPLGEADVARLRRLFDLDADITTIDSTLASDPLLAPDVRARPGVRVPGCWDGFELAVRAILGQQVTVRGATTLAGRLVARFGEPLAGRPAGLTHLFPRPGELAEADIAAIGMPGKRAAAIRGLAAATATTPHLFAPGLPLDEAVARLVALPGIGEWTAQYIAMRAMGCRDAFPASDLGLRRALGPPGKPASAVAVAAAGERWRPYRAYAAIRLWTGAIEHPPGDHET